MARVAKALLTAALTAISPEGAAGTITALNPNWLKKYGWQPKKHHHGSGRRLIDGGGTGIWINGLKNNLVFPFEEEIGCEGLNCAPTGPVDFFEVMWGHDINITDYTFTQYDASDGRVVSTYKFEMFSNFIDILDEDELPHRITVGIIYPSLPDIQGVSISKDCSGEIVDCVSYGNTSFTGADGAECPTTGVMDPSFNQPISLIDALEAGPNTMAISREGFCPGGSWSLQMWTPFFYNYAQFEALDAFFEEGVPFPLCPSHPCEPEPGVESCPQCKAFCEDKSGFDLEPYPHRACENCQDGFFTQDTDDAPNCEPSTGGWRCCVLSDFSGNKIYERAHDRCYCAGRRRRRRISNLGSSGQDGVS